MSLEDRLARLGLAHLINKPEELEKALAKLEKERRVAEQEKPAAAPAPKKRR
ncbi:MAG: hypothetical protein HY904_07950 [Deltaproteobacteria bacterium]|nr:hypothetical protein [Deltaproteobacteria bacterium]